MIEYDRLYSALSKITWGYFFIYFNINLNNVSILPTFMGYLMIFFALDVLKEEETEMALLKPLTVILILWHGASWLASWAAIDLSSQSNFITIIIELVDLYFHFQLLTNLASIAARHQPPGMMLDISLMQYRTVLTVLNTGIMIISYFEPWLGEVWIYIAVLILFVNVVITICLMRILFKLRKVFE